MRSRIAVAVLALSAWACAYARAVESKPTLKSLAEQVYCLCGCVTTLNRCPHLPSECSMRAQMEDQINKGMAQGKTETAIIQDLVLRYGVRVLATPPARGFNLTVWILPGVGLLAGLVFVIVMVRRWRRLSTQSANNPAAHVDPRVVAAVEEEIKRIIG